MTIAVTGATGQLGRLVIAQLKKRSPTSNIVALVRSPEKAKDLNVEARVADYGEPEKLHVALRGVDTLLLISGNEIGRRAGQHANVVTAAKAAGVKHIVYTSLLRADSSPLNLAPEHLETEANIKASGMAYTILRNGWYSENYTGSIGPALTSGAFYGSAGDGRIASAARADYAEAAAVVLTTQGHEGKAYELAGDSAYTLSELAATVSTLTGRQIPYADVPEADYAAALEGAGVPADFAAAIASWDVGARQGALYDDSRQLSKIIGRPTTPLAVSIEQVLR